MTSYIHSVLRKAPIYLICCNFRNYTMLQAYYYTQKLYAGINPQFFYVQSVQRKSQNTLTSSASGPLSHGSDRWLALTLYCF